MCDKPLGRFRDELDKLLMLASCGDASASDLERLNSLLLEHDELRRHAVTVLRDEALLREELQVLCASDLVSRAASSTSMLSTLVKRTQGTDVSCRQQSRFRLHLFSTRLRTAGLVACMVIGALIMMFFISRTTQNDSQPLARPDLAVQTLQESTDDGVAVLTQSVAAVWEQETALDIGDTIPLSVLRLKSGLAQVEFYSGALILMEGPAELELLSARQCFCRRGRIRVTVPRSAHGFTVLSPEIETVDLGTEFGLEVAPQGDTQVHVFDGKVELYSPGTQRAAEGHIEVSAGSGQQIERSGNFYTIPANPRAFVSSQELKMLREQEVIHRASLWRQSIQAMKLDQRVVAFYDFEPKRGGQDRVLYNLGNQGSALDGAIVGCGWSEGRWPGKQALDFKRPGDRVCIHVPGEFNALTLASWIRVDGLGRKYHSLMLTDGYEVGEIHWQILQTGGLRLGICHTTETKVPGTRDGAGHDYDSPAVFDLPQIGQWIHVAVVVDPVSGFVMHFANGRELSREPLHEVVKFRIGEAQIGNWKPYRQGMMIRNFNGRMDELIIAGHALKHEEIQDLYQKGKPELSDVFGSP